MAPDGWLGQSGESCEPRAPAKLMVKAGARRSFLTPLPQARGAEGQAKPARRGNVRPVPFTTPNYSNWQNSSTVSSAARISDRSNGGGTVLLLCTGTESRLGFVGCFRMWWEPLMR